MKIKRKNLYMIIIIIILIVGGIILSQNMGIEKVEDISDKNNEIIPQEEISDKQLRETVIKLYFFDEKNELVEEIRKIDSKILIDNPYKKVFEMLLENTRQENYKSYIPKETKLNDIKKNGEMIIIDLSEEFINNIEENIEYESYVIRQIVNTMTQFTEINSVKILINGSDQCEFKSGNIKFQQVFTNDD